MRTDSPIEWLLVRIAMAGSSGAIVIGGTRWVAHVPVNGFTAALLVPTLVFLLGVRSPRRVLIFGTLLVAMTAVTWTLFALHRRESTAGAGIVMGSFYSLICSIVGVGLELGRAPGGSPAANEAPPVDRAGGQDEVRPRAW